MRSSARGFTLIELLIVIVIIAVLAALAIPRLSQTRERASRAAMISDLKNLVPLQEAYYSSAQDYAGGFTSGPELIAKGAAGRVSFVPSPGNTVVLRRRTSGANSPGWSATVTNPSVKTKTADVCGIYVGFSGYAPNAKVTSPGSPACY